MDSVFKEIYQKYHNDIYQFLFYLVRNRELAEDLIQEVYIRVYRSYSKFENRSSLKTWLFSIARNVTIDHFRKEKNRKYRVFSDYEEQKKFEIPDDHKLPEEIAIQNERIQLLYKCLKMCTMDQQLVIVTRFIQDFSIAETAEVLGWSESKVKTTQHRALKALKKYMQAEMEKEGR